jgi:hypothetical protein
MTTRDFFMGTPLIVFMDILFRVGVVAKCYAKALAGWL